MAKFFSSPLINIFLAIFLISAFWVAGQNVAQTFVVARMSALNYLRPQQMDYLWKLNIHHAALNKNKIHFFKDYYEHLLRIFPSLGDAYGVLGYCYHYLNDDPRAIEALKTAIQRDPAYFWNYYNLSAIYINESRYPEACVILQKALQVEPMASFKRMFSSSWVYLPLVEEDDKNVLIDAANHLKSTYPSCLALLRLLNQAQSNNQMQEDLKKINLELYAF